MISKDGVILEVVEKHPGMEDVFRNYNDIAGKCTMCHNLFDILEEFANVYNLDLDVLITKFNRAKQKENRAHRTPSILELIVCRLKFVFNLSKKGLFIFRIILFYLRGMLPI